MNKLALYAFSLFVFSIIYSFIIFLQQINYEEVIFNNSSDGIAVLTGGKGRISLGLELFKNNRNLQLIISGVDKKVSDKSIVPDSLMNKTNITIDKESESTYQNAKIIHYTLGAPCFRQYRNSPMSQYWHNAYDELNIGFD